MIRRPPQETIRRKRDGGALSEEEIADFVQGIAEDRVTEGQAAAFAMAVFFQGMSAAECVALTGAMTRSGRTLTWPDLGRPVLDKHSTGGVGDKVSLMLAPILAACGAAVPMISGRGLGHTGGTLDKLDSIPGYDTAPDAVTFQRVVAEAHCAIIGQTEDLAPADRRLYAIRDVTATVESIPLITASILSKKLAAGLEGLVMDVKTGSGAFMARLEDARALAESIVGVAAGAGLPTRAVITDMNQVLGRTAGNALEVRESLDYLTGAYREPRLHQVVATLAAELLDLSGLASGGEEAAAMVERALESGAAAEAFARMCRALGGPSDILEAADRILPAAGRVVPVHPERAGYVSALDTRQVGLVVLGLGGGRTRADQVIDHAVGLADVAAIGEEVGPERPLATIHARSETDAEAAAAALRRCMEIGDERPPDRPVVLERIVRDA